jgi:hypothetical protein
MNNFDGKPSPGYNPLNPRETDSLYAAIPCDEKSWVPDKTCLSCVSCSSKFTQFNRRHHCRFCGQIFCNRCTGLGLCDLHSHEALRCCVACYEKAKIKFDDDAARRAKDVVASMNANLERFISVMAKPQPAVVDDDEPLPPPDDDDEPNDANAFLTAQQQRMAHFQEVFDQEAKKEEKFDELVDKLYNEGADQGGLAGWRSKTQSLTQLIPEAYWMADAATNNCLDCSLLFTNQV